MNQIHKNRRLRDFSILDSETRIKNVLLESIEYIIENEVYSRPHISWVSLGQLVWGEGVHFKDAPKHIKCGLLKHFGFRPVSKHARKDHTVKYGWDQGAYPYHLFPDIRGAINRNVIQKILNEKRFLGIEPLFGPGHFDKDTLDYDPKYPNAIMGYFFLLADKKKVADQNAFIRSLWRKGSTRHITLQYEHCKPAFEKHIREQIKGADNKINYKERLREFTHYEKISAAEVLPEKYKKLIKLRFIK